MWFLNDLLIFNPWVTTIILWILGIAIVSTAVFSTTHLLRSITYAGEGKPASKFTIPSFFAFIFFLCASVVVIGFSNNLNSYENLEGYVYSETSEVVESIPIVSLDHGFDMSGTVSGRYYVRSIELEQKKIFYVHHKAR